MSSPRTSRHLDNLKKEAKRWLKALRAHIPEARARLEQAWPDAPATPTLRDVQHALARERGFPGWTALTLHVDKIADYDRMVTNLLDAYRTGTPEAMQRHWNDTWHRRAWDGMRRYVRLDLGKREDDDVELTIADARYLVARDHGFETWQALVHDVSTRAPALQPNPAIICADAMTDDALVRVAQLAHVSALLLNSTPITDAGVAHLRNLRELEVVDLSWTRTGDAALEALTGKPKLRHLKTGMRVTDAGLPLLHEFPVFKTWHGGNVKLALLSPDAEPNSLWMRGSFTDRGMAALKGLDGLFALNIDDRALAITAAGLASLAELANLGFLAFDATDDTMPIIATMPKLRFLMCQDTVAGDDGFAALGRSQSIEYIWGRRCHNLRSRGFKALADMPALRGLSVSLLNVDDAGLSALPHFPALRELMPMEASDEKYRHIGKCENLESLVLMYCRDTTDVATSHITGLQNLKYYFASYTQITDRTPELLSTMTSLEEIEIHGCPRLTNAGIAKLARLPRLKELRISGMAGVKADVAREFPAGVRVTYSP